MTDSRFAALRAALPAALSAASGTEWREVPDSPADRPREHVLRLARTDGAGLGLWISNHERGKVRASIDSPEDAKRRALWWKGVIPYGHALYGTEAPDANMSLDKSAETIARDIVRRMLPKMAEAWPSFEAAKAATLASMHRFASVLDTLREMGATVHVSSNGSGTTRAYFKLRDGATIGIDIDENGFMRIPHFAPNLDQVRGIVNAMQGEA